MKCQKLHLLEVILLLSGYGHSSEFSVLQEYRMWKTEIRAGIVIVIPYDEIIKNGRLG